MNLQTELNDAQRAPVEQIEGPMMVIAGPGSGKTRVLTYRIAHMIDSGVDAFNILSLTFTNKAAEEMRNRIQKLVGSEAKNLWMGTFHSVFARILRIEASRIGFPSNFSIYDTTDSKSLIKRLVKAKGLDDKIYKPNIVYNRISNAKNQLINAQEYASNYNLTAEDANNHRPEIVNIYKDYVKSCFESGAMDFDDLLLKMYELLKNFPDVLYKYQHKFKFILVDEYQDTNLSQYTIVKMLASVYENICVVGDDAQSIYGFRGADIRNILEFQKDYPDLKTFKLEQNYRSTEGIVKIANQIISRNKNQLDKTIWTDNKSAQKVKIVQAASDADEAHIIAETIQLNAMKHNHEFSDFAILYRTNAQSRTFEESLRKKNIPYRIYGGLSFYQRREIKDFMAYLRLSVNHYDEEALRRVINYPRRAIGNTTMDKITVLANQSANKLWDVVSDIRRFDLGSRVPAAIDAFATMIKSFRIMIAEKNAYEVAKHISKTSGIMKDLHNDRSVEGLSRYENLQELLNSISEFVESGGIVNMDTGEIDNSLGAYLQNVSLLTDADQKDDENTKKVKLMTIHAAKGLEFKNVFAVGLEEGLFPSLLSMNSRADLEEERRLFYVAVTRAEQHLYISFANMRYRYGRLEYGEPSRFIDEISPLDVDFIGRKAKTPKPRFQTAKERKSLSSQITKSRSTPKVNKVAEASFVADDISGLQNGMNVEHARFGKGKVVHLEGEEPNIMASIQFNDHGQKRILLKYAKLKIL